MMTDDDINKDDDKNEVIQNIQKIQNRIKITSFDDEDGIRDGLSLNTVLQQLQLQQQESINDTETKSEIEIENILIICRLSFTNIKKSNQLIHLIQNGIELPVKVQNENKSLQNRQKSKGQSQQCYYWNKIIFEKNNCKDTKYIACVIQEAMKYTQCITN